MIPHLSDTCGVSRVRPDRRDEWTITRHALMFFYKFMTREWQSYAELATHGHNVKTLRTWAQKWEYQGMIEFGSRRPSGRGRATVLLRRID